MNVNQKIWLGFGSVLALVGVGSTLSFLKSREAEISSTRLVKEYLAEYTAAMTANEAISMARIHEQRFFNKNDENEAGLLNAELVKVRDGLTAVQTASPDPTRDQTAGGITTLAHAYGATFERAHQLQLRRGLTPDAGLEGQLRKAVQGIEATVKDQGLSELTVIMLMVRRHEKDYLLRGDPKYLTEINTRIKEFGEQMQQFSLPATMQKDISAKWATYAAAMKALVDGDVELKTATAELLRSGDEIEEKLGKLVEACAKDIERAQTTTLAVLAAGRKMILGIGVASGAIGAVMAVWIAFSLASLNRGIRRAAESIDVGSAEVAGASSQLTHSSQSLASGSSEQAASLEETSASLEELSSMTKRNDENAARAKDLATQTRAAADSGAAKMAQMKQAMDEIKSSSDDISKIIKTIDEIAFQTNILALNAAVEAARAGEAGMGFAVVADEVRNLAQRAAQSARETAGKIETSVAKSEHGVAISRDVAQSLAEIVHKAREVDSLVAEIAHASTEQSQGIGQVNSAVSQMDKVTQSNAGAAEECASAAEELNAQTTVLRGAATDLLALIGRTSAPASSAPAAIDAPASTLTRPSPVKKIQPAEQPVAAAAGEFFS